MNSLGTKLSSAVPKFHNLNSVTLSPIQFHEDIFADVLPALKHLPSLRNVTVNRSCTEETYAPILATIEGLSHLTVMDPSRAILNLFPEWLRRLSRTLTELHLIVLQTLC